MRVSLIIILAAVATAQAAETPAKAPFRVLYSNDTTNITTCVSPYHPAKADFTDAMLRASVDEAAGADVQLLQPGMGWIPWWKSKVYPAGEHYRYYEQKYKVKPNTFGRYMLAGGDVVATFIDQCRKRKVIPFISLRLNDGHGLENVGLGNAHAAHTVSRFYEDHYREWRIGPDASRWDDRVLNWAIPAVREQKLAFIRELCENYDLDGFELDFLRRDSYFQVDKTTPQERRKLMTDFVREVRQVLDRSARTGQRRWLCVRIPALLDSHERLGIDVAEFAAAGVDMFNLSCSYFTVQQTDLRRIRKLVPNAALYLEMTHTALTGKSQGGYDSFVFLRTTPAQFYTTAHLAYQQGADGVSLFNFVYYREHGGPGRGPFTEPPFDVLPRLADRDFLSRQPQWYFQAASLGKPLAMHWPLRATIAPGKPCVLEWELAPRAGQKEDAIVRLRFDQPVADRAWRAVVNGTALEPAAFRPKPIEHPYEAFLGDPAEYACFRCPRSMLRNGVNTINVSLAEGKSAQLVCVDLVLP